MPTAGRAAASLAFPVAALVAARAGPAGGGEGRGGASRGGAARARRPPAQLEDAARALRAATARRRRPDLGAQALLRPRAGGLGSRRGVMASPAPRDAFPGPEPPAPGGGGAGGTGRGLGRRPTHWLRGPDENQTGQSLSSKDRNYLVAGRVLDQA